MRMDTEVSKMVPAWYYYDIGPIKGECMRFQVELTSFHLLHWIYIEYINQDFLTLFEGYRALYIVISDIF